MFSQRTNCYCYQQWWSMVITNYYIYITIMCMKEGCLMCSTASTVSIQQRLSITIRKEEHSNLKLSQSTQLCQNRI